MSDQPVNDIQLLIDVHGKVEIARAMSVVCYGEAEHLAGEHDDPRLECVYNHAGETLEDLARELETCEEI